MTTAAPSGIASRSIVIGLRSMRSGMVGGSAASSDLASSSKDALPSNAVACSGGGARSQKRRGTSTRSPRLTTRLKGLRTVRVKGRVPAAWAISSPRKRVTSAWRVIISGAVPLIPPCQHISPE